MVEELFPLVCVSVLFPLREQQLARRLWAYAEYSASNVFFGCFLNAMHSAAGGVWVPEVIDTCVLIEP